MKTIYLLGATLAFALFSCSNDNDALISTIESAPLQTRSNQQIGFSVVNGCVYFTDMNAYQQVLLSLKEKSEDELLEWSKSYGYTSLLESYKQKENSLRNGVDNIELTENDIEMASISEASLHNKDGIF